MPTALSRLAVPTVRRLDCYTIMVARFASTVNASPPLKQINVKEGHFTYSRDVSRDSSNPNPQKRGDTPSRFLFNRLGHAFEVGLFCVNNFLQVWPLFGLIGFWACIFCLAVFLSFNKIEVWLDRSNSTPPWHW